MHSQRRLKVVVDPHTLQTKHLRVALLFDATEERRRRTAPLRSRDSANFPQANNAAAMTTSDTAATLLTMPLCRATILRPSATCPACHGQFGLCEGHDRQPDRSARRMRLSLPLFN